MWPLRQMMGKWWRMSPDEMIGRYSRMTYDLAPPSFRSHIVSQFDGKRLSEFIWNERLAPGLVSFSDSSSFRILVQKAMAKGVSRLV